MTTQLQQCREVAAALDEEVTEWRRKDAEWHEHRSDAEKALRDMPFVMDNYRAALARAEAAEALINEYHERTVAAEREASLCANALETARSRWAEAERREKSIFDDAMGIADKAIYGNQLKCTVGDIFKSIKTFEDGVNVDATFSTTSFEARIVSSFIKIGLLSTGMRKIEETALNMYFR